MDLDFETNKYDLFDDWHQNKTKQAFTQKLQQQAQIEPGLFIEFQKSSAIP